MGTHVHCGGLSAFSALHLLRSYNHLLGPTGADLGPSYHPLLLTPGVPPFQGSTPPNYPHLAPEYSSQLRGCSSFPPLLPLVSLPSSDKRARHATGGSTNSKRPRGEKKPIPDEQKDEKYFERRKRNNQAAKKSRDARKLREDQIALRAAYLEEERAIHRSQEQVLRSQVQSLSRQIQLLTSQVQTLSSEKRALSTENQALSCEKEALSKELQTARLLFKITQQQQQDEAQTQASMRPDT